MANFEINFPDDFLSDLLDSDFEEVAKAALEETAPTLKTSIQSSIRSVVSHTGDSELVNSVKISKPKRTSTDAWIINVGPAGKSSNYYYSYGTTKRVKRKYAVSNVLKAIWLEYGRVGQNAKPWLTSATENVRGTIMDKMQDIYNKKVGAK